MAPMIGYLPGHMPYKFGERLQRLGVTLVNKKADSTCHVDRKLITGASPEAANDFGRLVAQQLLSFYNVNGPHDPIESTI
jgi:molecular chaperone Hsp31 and glyoxalase 3